jgi:nucleoside-diphosphate-sugar epimerase
MAVARLLDAATTGRPFPLRGDGSQRRDLTHVDDVVRATMAAIEAPLVPGTVINVGSGRPIALRDLITEIERQTGVTVPTVGGPTAPGDPARTAADRSRAGDLLRWRPLVELGDGIADQLAHHRADDAVAETVA